jgi:acyl dehydratase
MGDRREIALAPIDRVQIAKYAGASGDYNPMHVDEPFAQSVGMPSVIAHGPLTASLAIHALVSEGYQLKSFDARLRAPVFPADELTLTVDGTDVSVSKADGTVVLTATIESR